MKSTAARSKNGEKNQFVTTYLPLDLIDGIEKAKGDISRNLFIRRAITKALQESGTIQK